MEFVAGLGVGMINGGEVRAMAAQMNY